MRPARLPSRAAAALIGAALLVTATGCAEAKVNVEGTSVDVEAGTPAPEASAVPAEATPAPVVEGLNPTAETLGAVQLQLPSGWAVTPGSVIGAPGEGAVAMGAATYEAVAAEGKDQATWVADLVSVNTDLAVDSEGMEAQAPITAKDGREVFHLVQSYSDNRAHLFGFVDGDTLHLVRYGLDGTPESASAAAASLTTLTLVG